MDTRRAYHAGLAVLAGANLVVQVVLTATGDAGTPIGRFVNLFSYFTVLTNLLVTVVEGRLAQDPDRDGRWWRVVRFAAVLSITVVFLVYVAVLRPLADFEGLALVTDIVFHYVVPIAAVLGWLLLEARGRLSGRVLGLALVYPVGYLGWTVLHGALSRFYPYPFIDADQLGYPLMTLNCVLLTMLFAVLGAGFVGLDRALARRAQSVLRT